MQPILSILICHLHKRAGMLGALLRSLQEQIDSLSAQDKVEILIKADNGELATGTKRNHLLLQAKGEYIVFVDDDDRVSDIYIEEILTALNKKPDVIGFEGRMTTDGKDAIRFRISRNLSYKAETDKDGMWYARFNNHLSPVKRIIALAIMFKDIKFGEDYDYAIRMKNSGLIKTEEYIHKDLYFYDFKSNKM